MIYLLQLLFWLWAFLYRALWYGHLNGWWWWWFICSIIAPGSPSPGAGSCSARGHTLTEQKASPRMIPKPTMSLQKGRHFHHKCFWKYIFAWFLIPLFFCEKFWLKKKACRNISGKQIQRDMKQNIQISFPPSFSHSQLKYKYFKIIAILGIICSLITVKSELVKVFNTQN